MHPHNDGQGEVIPLYWQNFFLCFLLTIITEGDKFKETTVKHNILKQEKYSNKIVHFDKQ